MEGVGKCIGVWGEVREGVLGVWEVCWGVRKYGVVWGMGVGVWKCVWGVAKCVWDVGKGVERVLEWGQSGGCKEVWEEIWDNLGERENMGRRVVSRFWTSTLLTPTLQPQPP